MFSWIETTHEAFARARAAGLVFVNAVSEAIVRQSASIGRHARRVAWMAPPYRHELSTIAKQLGCTDEPFRCWLEIERLQANVARADKLRRDLDAVRASFRAEVRKAAGETIEGLRAALEALEERKGRDADARAAWAGLGFELDQAPQGADLVVWLMSELEATKARLETERASTRAFQGGIVDLVSVSRSLRARIVELELLQGVPAAAIEAADVA